MPIFAQFLFCFSLSGLRNSLWEVNVTWNTLIDMCTNGYTNMYITFVSSIWGYGHFFSAYLHDPTIHIKQNGADLWGPNKVSERRRYFMWTSTNQSTKIAPQSMLLNRFLGRKVEGVKLFGFRRFVEFLACEMDIVLIVTIVTSTKSVACRWSGLGNKLGCWVLQQTNPICLAALPLHRI